MKTGISSYTYTWAIGVPGHEPQTPLDTTGLLQKAIDNSLSVVQIADNLPLHLLGNEKLEELCNMASRSGIELEAGARGLTHESLASYVEIARIIKARILRFVIDGAGYEPEPRQVVTIIKSFLRLLEKHNIILALENHDRFPSSTFREMMQSINHPSLGICLDSVNSLGIAEGLETVVENLAPYTVNLHVKDFSIKRIDHKMGFIVEGVPAGKGFLDLPSILSKLKPWNKCHSAIIELWTPPEASISQTIEKEDLWAIESIQYLKQIFT